MKINIDEIKNNVVPKLNNSINYLEQAINSIAACSIPEYFNYEEYMYKLPNNIRYIKNDVNVVKSWAEDIFIKFENAERNNNSIVSKLNINSIGKVNSKVSANSNNRKVMDEPEVQEGLKNLNNLLNIQNKELSDNAEKMKNSIRSKTYNPYLESLLKEYCNTKDFENLSEVYFMSNTLKNITEQLDLYLVDGKIPKAEIITETNGKKKVQFAGLVFTYEDWKMIQHYLKSKGITWYDLKEEFREAYGLLQTYYGELLERKNSIYSLERYIDLYPYTYITKKDGFKEYLERDFTNVNPESEFNLLTQEEKAIYYYLKEKYSEEDARKYYESLKDIINQRKGELQALEYISTLDLTGLESVDGVSNFLMTTGVGFKDGVWQFGENIVNLIPGQGEIRSELQYKQMYIMQMLTQEINIDEIAKKYGKDSEVYKQYEKLKKMQEVYKQALGVNYNVASAIGNQAIPIAVSFIPVAGKYIGTGLIALSAAGGAKAQAYQNGVTGWDAYLYAGIQGITSAVVTKYFAAIPGLSANASTTITGILKGATQAGLSAVAQSKIDEFTLKVLSKQPGEAITLDELLKQDAKTFITAFSTAFILNGGQALLVKIKGKEVKITPEDLEKCIGKDGNLDIEKLIAETSIIEKLKEKFQKSASQLPENTVGEDIDWTRFNTQDIDFTQWATARDAYYSFYEQNKDIFLAHGKKIDDVTNNFNNVCMCSDADYFNYIKNYYGHSKACTAFNHEGRSFLPANSYAKDIAHEVTHSWGNLYIDDSGNFNIYYNSVNEAVTETIACSMGFYNKTDVSYTCNIEYIERITQQLAKRGYKNAFLDAYLASDVSQIKSIIDSIAGNGYYDELAYRMYENQQEFVKGYNNNWTNSNYNRTADKLDVFLNALD